MRMFKRLGILLSMLFAVSFLTACDSSGGDSDSVAASQQARAEDDSGPACIAPQVETADGQCVCPADDDQCIDPPSPPPAVVCSVANHAEWNGFFSSLPETLAVACANGPRPDDMVITLNGADITNQFELNATGAVILGDKLSELAKNADNKVEVKPAGANASVTFTYDKLPPRVVITSVDIIDESSRKLPTEGDMLLVKGLVHDVSDIVSVSINGVEADLAEDKTFSVEIDNTDKYVVEAEDATGARSSLSYATHTKAMDSSLAIQLNQSMMNFILPMVTDVLADFKLPVDPKVKALTYKKGLCGSRAGCAAAFTKLNMSASDSADPSITVEFAPAANGDKGFIVDVELAIPKMEIGFKVYESKNWVAFRGLTYWSKIWYKFPVIDIPDMVVNNSNVIIKMAMLLDEESGEYKMVLDNDWMKFDMGSMKINKIGLNCNYDSTPWEGGRQACMLRASGNDRALKAINAFMGSPLLDIEGKIDEMMNGTAKSLGVFAQLGNQLENMPMEEMLPGAITFDLDKDGKADTEIKDILTISELDADRSGNAMMAFGSHFFVEEEALKEGYQGTLGSVYNEVVVPVMPSDIDGAESDLGVAVSANMINQVMLGMYQTGVMDSIEIPMKTDDLCSFKGAFMAMFGVGADDDLRIRMNLGAVPYMLLDGSTDMAGISVRLDNVLISMDYKPAGSEEFIEMMAMVTNINSVFKLGVNADSSLKLDLSEFVDMHIQEIVAPANLVGIGMESLVGDGLGVVVGCMMSGLDLDGADEESGEGAVPTLELDLGEIAASDDEIKETLDKLFPMDIGMIFRQFAVDNNDSYLMIAIDLEELTEEQAESGDMGGEPASMVLRLTNEEVAEAE